MAQKISQLTALSTTYKDTDIIEVSVDAGAGAFVTRKMTFLQLRTAFTKLEANLDVNSFQITSASNGNIIIRPNGSGAVLIGGNSTQATELRFMEDSDNGTNYVAMKVAAALAASTTYTLPSADGTSGQVLSTNGSGTLSWATAGGGLTKFTEAESTTSPNATVYVDSLTAAGSTTNVDIAIVPKGSGALMLDIPDSTSAGGNKRGANAIDLQTTRGAASRVASGDTAVAIGGDNTASAQYSSVIGYSNTANAIYTFAGGYSNTTSAVGSTALGWSNTSSSTASCAVGYANTCSAEGTFASGYQNNVSQGYSYALGKEHTVNAMYTGALGFKANINSVKGRHATSLSVNANGDCQTSTFLLYARTTGNTATTLTALGEAASTITQVILLNNSAIRFKGTIIGKKSGTTDVAAWDIDGLIVRGANAASTTLSISTVTVVQNTPAWGTPTLAADTTNGGLQVQVTGAAATNIQWTANIETTEVIYA